MAHRGQPSLDWIPAIRGCHPAGPGLDTARACWHELLEWPQGDPGEALQPCRQPGQDGPSCWAWLSTCEAWVTSLPLPAVSGEAGLQVVL